jgi:RNA polymerase sigma-70 factor (ECF subfamily)
VSEKTNVTPPGFAEMEEILGKHEGSLTRYAMGFTKDLEKARDIVQDTFLRLCKVNYEEIKPYLAQWLFTVCRNRALDMYRKDRRKLMDVSINENENIQLQSDPSLTSPGDTPQSKLERKESKIQVTLCLQTLPENQQEVIRLKFQEGLSYKEISEVTGKSVSHVGVLIHNGMCRLRKTLLSSDGEAPRHLREVS